jgi:hypothetical protein
MKYYISIFILLIVYAVFLAPGSSNASDPIMMNLLSGRFQEVDPLVTAVFSMLGIYPVIFLMLLFPKDKHRLPAWPFALLSFGLGAFSILPYMAVRGKKTRSKTRVPLPVEKFLLHPIFISVLLLVTLIVYGTAFYGSLQAYTEAFTASHLVSVMTIDFFIVIWLCYDLLKKDWGCRYALLAFLPALGPLLLLLFRSRWKAAEQTETN